MRKPSLQTSLFVVVLIAMITAIFWEPFTSGKSLFSGDGPPVYEQEHQAKLKESFVGRWDPLMAGVGRGGRAFHPLRIPELILPPLVYHTFGFILDVILVILATVFFLRGHGIKGWPALLGGLAFGFSGYYFTLISAGHRTVFDMMPCAIFLMGCLNRAVCKPSIYFGALAGLCAAFGLATQPDIMGLFGGLALMYALFLFIREIRQRENKGAFFGKVAAAGAMAIVFLIMVGLPAFAYVKSDVLPVRNEARGRTPEAQWEYATNWSMPPEEILEFIVPSIYGYETGHKEGPYWGRLGRSMNYAPGKPGFMNFRQHTVYIGAIPVFFALYALFWALSPKGFDLKRKRSVILFFSWTAFICTLLSFGRYFPIYKLFYLIPGCSSIRCPVKFVHLIAFSICVLFAFGLLLFTQHIGHLARNGKEGKKKKDDDDDAPTPGLVPIIRKRLLGFMIFAFALGLILWLNTIFAGNASMKEKWAKVGLAGAQEVLTGNLRSALFHGGLLFMLLGALFAVIRSGQWTKAAVNWIMVALLCVLAIDIVLVTKPFIHVRDVSAFYADNPVADRINKEKVPGRLSYHLSRPSKLDPMYRNLINKGIDIIEPRQDKPMTADYRAYFGTVNKNPFRFWQLTNSRFVTGPVASMQQMVNHPNFKPVLYYNLAAGGIFESAPDGKGQHVLLRFDAALPRALVYHSWEQMSEEDALRNLVSPKFEPGRSLIVTGGGVETTKTTMNPTINVSISKFERTHITMKAVSPADGILLLNDKYDSNWNVTVDGKPAELLRCNYIMRGVRIPPGNHSIAFTYKPFKKAFTICLIGCSILIIWTGINIFLNKKRAKAPVEEK